MGRYFLFGPYPNLDAGYNYEHFAFEPMSHSANAHNLPNCAGMRRLAPGELLSGSIRLDGGAGLLNALSRAALSGCSISPFVGN